jgi:hypothetical protein
MKEFLLIFRNVAPTGDAVLSPEQLKDISKPWIDWMGGMAAQNKLASQGNRLSFDGATVKADGITDGPYAEIKEIILGYSIVKTDTLEDANELAKGCPVLLAGGSVEVRGIVAMGA